MVNRIRNNTLWRMFYRPTFPCCTFPVSRLVRLTTSVTVFNWMLSVGRALTTTPLNMVLVSLMNKSFRFFELLALWDEMVWTHANAIRRGHGQTYRIIQVIRTRWNSRNQFGHGQRESSCIVFDVYHTIFAVSFILDLSLFNWGIVSTVRSLVRICTDTLKIN